MPVENAISILLVEDSDIMRRMEAKILKDLGFTNLLEAADGKVAVEILESGQQVDLIISDWNMPNMDGYQLLQWVRAHAEFNETAFMMATAQSERKQVEAATSAGVSAMVSKPFTPDELSVKIEEAFSEDAGGEKELAVRELEMDADGKVCFNIAHIQITDHLVLGVLKHLIDNGDFTPSHFTLNTHCLPGWNPVQTALEDAEVDGALVLAPIGMDLFGYGVPIRLCLLAHKNGSIFVRNKIGDFNNRGADFFRDKTFYIPHRQSVHHMLSHRYLTEMGLHPGVPGDGDIDVTFEVVPPIKMPELLSQNPSVAGYMVAEPLGTKAVAAGTAEVHFLSGQMWGHHPCCVVTLRKELIDTHPEAVQEFTDGLVEAGKFIDAKPGLAAEIAVNFLDPKKALGLKKAVLQNVLTEPGGITTDDLYPVVEDLSLLQDYMCDTMGVGTKVDMEEFVDSRFAENSCGPDRCDRSVSDGLADAASLHKLATQDSAATKSMLSKEGKYLTFRLADEDYGIGILKIKEIIGMQPITVPPRMPEFVKGIINLRGRIIPVIDLKLRMGMAESEATERTCIIVLEIHGPTGLLEVGAITDTVSEVINVKGDDIQDTPEFGRKVETKYITGMALIEGQVKILLDIDSLLSDGELEAISSF